MPISHLPKVLLFAAAAAATLAAALVAGQGAVTRKKSTIPTELLVKPPEKAPMVYPELLKVDPNVIISRKSAFKPLDGKMTLTPMNPIGANGAIFCQHVYGFNIVEGRLSFRDESAGAGVYFRPTKAGAEYLAEFVIEVHEDTEKPFEILAAGYDGKPAEKKTYSEYSLKKGIHKLTTSFATADRDFTFAYLLTVRGGWWSLHSATIRRAD